MASRFVVPDRDQVFMAAVSYREVLGDDHPVWTVIDVVDVLDLSVVYGRYGQDPAVGGRPAIDPRVLLSLLIFGYSEGKRSSRELEVACRRDWAYRAICGDRGPDHATIARFRQRLDDVLAGLFAQVLAVCAGAGLVEVGLVALDGTKMGAAASKGSNRTADTLARLEGEARAMLDEAASADTAVDTAGPDGCGGGGGWSEARREAEAARRVARIGEAVRVVADAEARRVAEEKKRGKPKRPVANTTDPDSRVMKTHDGAWIQGFNAQAVATADQVVIAAEVVSDPTDVAMLEPMFVAAQANLDAAGIVTPIGVGLADAGYWSAANAAASGDLATDMLIATTKSHQVGTVSVDDAAVARDAARVEVIEQVVAGKLTAVEAGRRIGLSARRVRVLASRYRDHHTLESAETIARHQMQSRLAEPTNRDLYRQRGWLIEGCFAHLKVGRRTRQFSRRGLESVNAEWKLIHIAGNISKLHRHRHRGPNPPHRPSNAASRRRQRARIGCRSRFNTRRPRQHPKTRHHPTHR